MPYPSPQSNEAFGLKRFGSGLNRTEKASYESSSDLKVFPSLIEDQLVFAVVFVVCLRSIVSPYLVYFAYYMNPSSRKDVKWESVTIT